MSIGYTLNIENPHQHYVSVELSFDLDDKGQANVFMPSWSPGSYLLREYARFVRKPAALDSRGAPVEFAQIEKGTWQISGGNVAAGERVHFKYEVYCHELTVRTSYVDGEFAFIHGPSVFMGVEHLLAQPVTLKLSFPATWSKISTGLKDVSPTRDSFEYSSPNYDDFVDCPIQIGCHFTDGFKVNGKDHEIAFYGECLPHNRNLKSDMQKIVEHISDYMGEIPYEKYVFMTHLVQGLYGGLEHKNSTALQFCSRGFKKDKDYLNWLCLVSHEYFHTWNVKRIRPKGFGPFDYKKQFDSSMLWLAEGLTSFMDELFVYQCGLATIDEYLEMQTKNLNRYFSILGRRFHSLETSGFNAWDVLYKPHENSLNSSISYYLKGGISFFLLNILLVQNGSSTKEFISKLWEWYKKTPEEGMKKEDVLQIIEELGGISSRESFEEFIETTIDLPITSLFKEMGLGIDWDLNNETGFGFVHEIRDSRVFIKTVELDSAAFNDGLNSGDEVLAINNLRVDKENISDHLKNLSESHEYNFTISRLGKLLSINLKPKVLPKKVKAIKVLNKDTVESYLKGELS